MNISQVSNKGSCCLGSWLDSVVSTNIYRNSWEEAKDNSNDERRFS
uniref:Uncharacterized protein n=1 Tax=Anguilla anguilla TaxID=7936 RepID=A0A0E9TQX1_ANGAN